MSGCWQPCHLDTSQSESNEAIEWGAADHHDGGVHQPKIKHYAHHISCKHNHGSIFWASDALSMGGKYEKKQDLCLRPMPHKTDTLQPLKKEWSCIGAPMVSGLTRPLVQVWNSQPPSDAWREAVTCGCEELTFGSTVLFHVLNVPKHLPCETQIQNNE